MSGEGAGLWGDLYPSNAEWKRGGAHGDFEKEVEWPK